MSVAHLTTTATIPNSKTMLDLNKLVNLALNSPRVGIVNFNILKTFLIELLKALNLQHYEPKFGDDPEAKHLLQYIIKANEEQDNTVHTDGNNNSHLDNNNNDNDTTGYESEMINLSLDATGNAGASSVKGYRVFDNNQKPVNERFINLEDKLTRLEQQLSALNTLPPNSQLIEKAKDAKKANSSHGPILEIWQYTQLSKRLESAEDGLTKLTSIMQDLIGDINELKDGQAKNASELQRLNDNYTTLNDRINFFEKLKNDLPSKKDLEELEREIDLLREGLGNANKLEEKLKALQNQLKALEAKLAAMLTANDLIDFVTWPALENSMKGLKDMLDSTVNTVNSINQRKASTVQPPQTIVHVVHATQTTPTPPPQPSSRPSSSKQHPSLEFQEILSKLGTVNDRHEGLKELVEKLKKDLDDLLATRPTSPKKSEFVQVQQSLKLPDDFAAKLDEIMKLRSDLDELRKNLSQESGKRLQLENLLSNLNNEIDKLKQTLKECLESTRLNRDDIKSLQEAIKILEQTKADKDWVRQEFDKKADKRDLDNKVQKKAFEDSVNELSHNLNNCLQKTNNLEDEMKRENEKIAKELDCKLDRLELDPLKEYIEKQLKKLRKIQKEAQESYIKPEDDAAGMRKQLLRFHCISCDRPIEASTQPPLPSLPNERGLRPIQSPRPFTTYELDQIRQFQKQQQLSDTGYELFSNLRQCGGSHTLTLPHKRVIKVPPQVAEEPQPSIPIPSYRPEVQIQGQDGHIYKGRIDAKLTVEVKKPIKNSNQLHINSHNSFSANNLNERPNSVINNRPISTKVTNNNNSNNNNNQSTPTNGSNNNNNNDKDNDQLDQIPVYTN